MNELEYGHINLDGWDEIFGDEYNTHIYAMTSEGLNSKSEIAVELAYRDWKIKQLESELALFKFLHSGE